MKLEIPTQVIGLLYVGVIGLLFKIAYDWLKGRGKDAPANGSAVFTNGTKKAFFNIEKTVENTHEDIKGLESKMEKLIELSIEKKSLLEQLVKK